MDTFVKEDELIQSILTEKELEDLLIQSTLTDTESANVEDNIDEITRQSNVARVNAMRHHYWF